MRAKSATFLGEQRARPRSPPQLRVRAPRQSELNDGAHVDTSRPKRLGKAGWAEYISSSSGFKALQLQPFRDGATRCAQRSHLGKRRDSEARRPPANA